MRLLLRIAYALISLPLVGSAQEAVAQTCTPPPPGLLGWWDAAATSGTTVRDLASANSGTMIGGVNITPDPQRFGPRPFPRAFHFDGGGLIDIGNPAAFRFGTRPFSLQAWFVLDRGEAEYPHIISKYNYPVSGPGAGYWIRLTPDGQTVEFFIGETVGLTNFPRARITAPVGQGIWHYIVGTRDEQGIMRLFVDGTITGSAHIDPAFSVDSGTTAAAPPFTIGAWNDRFGIRNYAFTGYMADVSVYGRALNADEIHALFSAPKCKAAPR